MESFMFAPVGSFQKGVGDADGGSAPHRKHSITIATGPRQIDAAAIRLTSPLRCSYSARLAFPPFKCSENAQIQSRIRSRRTSHTRLWTIYASVLPAGRTP